LATRHKISRKELKQPDEFQSIFETAGLFFELHMTEVLLGAGALLVIVALALGLYYYEVRQGHAAAARFDQALSDLQAAKFDVAEKELSSLAASYEELGDYKQAEDAYRQASKIEGPEQARAELGVARMLQRQGKRAEAIVAYNEFLTQHPYAPERAMVMETLAQLGVAPPSTPAAPPTVKIIKPASAP
jgi:tetratricopeptide (TPR) repeat protein